ncbi:MAG: PKD domain-containing protein [Candidatus Cyclobacteriaceae bacterium M3_2C_046]
MKWKILIMLIVILVCGFYLQAQPLMVELSLGESKTIKMPSGKTASIKLLDLKEHTEPYFQLTDSSIVEAVTTSEVEIMVNEQKYTLKGGPFQQPDTIGGFTMLVACTRGFAGGIFSDGLQKDVRIEVNDASALWYGTDEFIFPIHNYRWHASNYRHTYLGIVPNQSRLYYHRGEDFGMIPDLEKTLALTSGKLLRKPPPQGDGSSNAIWLQHQTGLISRFIHLNEYNVNHQLEEGQIIPAGELLGLTGNTYAGHRSPSPHLHVSLHNENNDKQYFHSFPAIVKAYQNSFPGELMPVAGNLRHLFEGETIILDGSKSLAGQDRKIRKFEWRFTDGEKATGALIEKTYPKAGVYSEELRVFDQYGNWERDFVEVNVLEKNQQIKPPRAWINYYPIRGIKAGTDIRFLIRFNNLEDVKIDYGDGTKVPYTENSYHVYQIPGNYLVTVSGSDAGAGPGTFHVRVIVEK